MQDNELIEILKEFDEKRVEQLNDNARNLFNAIMKIANQRDRLLVEKQELIDYLKEQISNLHWEMSELSLGMCDTKFQRGKLSAYEEILGEIEKRNK